MKKTNLPKKIAHIADVHIFNQKRHHEHIYVIDNLAKSLKEENPDLIYIAGDIVDSKAKLSPEQIDVASHFFYRLSNIAPIICIIGNHDANLYIKDKMDSLSPIISEIDSINPIYLLRDSGVYNLYNIDWIVWSRLDTTIPIENYKFGVNYSIGCYHGPVEGAVTDTGWNKFSKTMKLKSFDNCDTVLLGDIHKAQYFKTTKAKNKEYNNCAFSGSLLQVNVGEDEEKGYLIWSYDEALSTYTSTFKPVENKYSIKTIHAKNISEANYKNTQLIRLIVPFETTPADIINIKNSISNDVIIHREKKNKVEIDSDLTEAKVVNEMPSEEEYFANYFKELGLSGKVINSLKKLDKKFANLTENVFIGNDLNEYSLKEIEIKNFLVFGGEASKVNFEEKKGLVGLFGSNGIGKSSLMIAIMFCLFNKTLKDSNKFIKLINDQLEDYSEEIFVKLTLIINGSLWEIKRSIIPKKQSASIRLEVYEYVGGKKTPRHLEDRIQTDKQVLMPLIGNEEVFSTTVLSSQNQSAEFTDKKNSDRLELTNKFLGLDNYAKKYEIANKKLLLLKAENSTLVKNIENFEKPEEIKEKILLSKDVIRENKLALKSLQRNIEEKNEQQKQLQEKINAIPFISLKMTWEEAEELLLSLKKEIKEDLEKI
jgi:DNA repair exonuclease SbcCD nuclease subunit